MGNFKNFRMKSTYQFSTEKEELNYIRKTLTILKLITIHYG